MPSGIPIVLAACFVCVLADVSPCLAQVRDRAVLSLTFDDLNDAPSSAADSAKGGKISDAASLTRTPARVPSAFVTGSPGYSLLLDPAHQQQIVIPTSEDSSRADVLTVSGLFASLHAPDDATFHGLFAKRKTAAGDVTNYGINYQPSTDNFQVYVNDGAGYKVLNYSVKTVLGYRRRVHLALSLDHGDAPGADADSDVDDIRVRLFVNGELIAPLRATGGLIDGNVGWLQDAGLAKCVSDTPLTIGSSFVDGEFTRMFCDEIHLFAEALSNEDVKVLFTEIAGGSAADISADQGSSSGVAIPPQITRLSPQAAEVGKTTRLVVAGQSLVNARLHTDVPGISVAVAEGGNDSQGLFDVSVGAGVVPGRYLLRCVNPGGVSNPVIVSVDRVATHPDGTFTEASPAESFPVSVAGLISGAELKRVWFKGIAGQKVVAEIEARRIGSKLDPVVEIRSRAGTPLAIQWQQSELSGDARASVALPADGLYFAEVHDLQFKAAGASPWRVFVGDLPPASLAFPGTAVAASSDQRTVSADAVSESLTVTTKSGRISVASGNTLLPLPALRTDSGTQVTEPVEGTFPATPIDATFTVSPFPALLVNGRIAAPKETDVILLTVTPGQNLHFAVAARQLSSSLRAHLAVLNGDAVIAQNDGESGASDPSFSLTVPEAVTQLKVQIHDVNQKGSASSIYRLLVSRSDRPAFVVSTRDSGLRLPLNGSAPLRLSVVRQSPSFRYTGPIRLAVTGAPGVAVVPDVIPASDQNQQILVMVTRSAAADAATLASGQGLVIEAKAEGASPVFSTSAMVIVDSVPANSLTLPDTTLVAGPADSVPAALLVDAVPPILFRGLSASIAVRIIPVADSIPAFARFEMITTEEPRREDPNKPDSPFKPLVSLNEFQFGRVEQGEFALSLRVPVDTPASVIDTVISADFVAQPLASTSGSKAWTAPLMLFVDDAVTLTVPAEPFKGGKTAVVNVTGSLKRHPLFSEAVSVVIDGLPAGFTAVPVSVAADQTAFSMPVTIPDAAASGEVPNVTLRVQHSSGATISRPVPVKLVVE